MSTKTSAKVPVTARVTHRFSAAPERVFDAWLDPERAARFLFATPTGEMVRVEIDARVGGTFRIVERRGSEEAGHYGEFLEIDRPRRLVFTFATAPDARNADAVVVEIVPAGTGCELTLTHQLKPEWAAYAGRTEEGWSGILDGLAVTLGERQGHSVGDAS